MRRRQVSCIRLDSTAFGAQQRPACVGLDRRFFDAGVTIATWRDKKNRQMALYFWTASVRHHYK